MDEPTNHLDVVSREALEDALDQYEGTLLLVSHDRYFLDKIISRVVEVKDKNILEYAGNYSYYHEKREKGAEMEPSKKEKVKTALLGKKTKEQKRQEAEARQQISKTRNTIETSIQWLEREIDKLESRKKEIEDLLCRPDIYQEKDYMLSLQKELPLITKQLQEYYSDWEKGRIELEELLGSLEVVGQDDPKE
jgi:ATP-binding cassette subfamily F protein 3